MLSLRRLFVLTACEYEWEKQQAAGFTVLSVTVSKMSSHGCECVRVCAQAPGTQLGI